MENFRKYLYAGIGIIALGFGTNKCLEDDISLKSVEIRDYNMDGINDIIVHKDSGEKYIYLRKGTGNYNSPLIIKNSIDFEE